MNGWKHKDAWVKRAKHFTVEVSRHELAFPEVMDLGPNRWAVYLYVYPEHPFFKRIEEERAALAVEGEWRSSYPNMVGYLPLHGGCTFFQVHRNNEGKVTSYQIGADYSHYRDEHYSWMKNREGAFSIFQDAEELIAYAEKGELV